MHLAKSEDLDADPFQWWKKYSKDMPCWSTAAKKVLLLQPSSAAAKQVSDCCKTLLASPKMPP